MSMFIPSEFGDDRVMITNGDTMFTVVRGIADLPYPERCAAINAVLAAAEFKADLAPRLASILLIIIREGIDAFEDYIRAEAIVYGVDV